MSAKVSLHSSENRSKNLLPVTIGSGDFVREKNEDKWIIDGLPTQSP